MTAGVIVRHRDSLLHWQSPGTMRGELATTQKRELNRKATTLPLLVQASIPIVCV
jgi:hypothetical protein